jgi:hypothetical protein
MLKYALVRYIQNFILSEIQICLKDKQLVLINNIVRLIKIIWTLIETNSNLDQVKFYM